MTFSLDTRPVFTAKELTAAYVVQTAPAYIELAGVSEVALDIGYTMGATETANVIDVRIEYADPTNDSAAPVATDWHIATAESTTAGVTTVSLQNYSFTATQAAATYDYFHVVVPVVGKYMRVAIKETGKATNFGTTTIKATLKREQSNN